MTTLLFKLDFAISDLSIRGDVVGLQESHPNSKAPMARKASPLIFVLGNFCGTLGLAFLCH